MYKRYLNYKLIILLILALNCGACVDQINYDLPPEDYNTLAIQGRLLKGASNIIRVEVKRIFGYRSGSSFVYADSVHLSNHLGQVMNIESVDIGVYESNLTTENPDFEVDYGGQYKITVWTVDDRVYTSSFEKLHPVPQIDSVSIAFFERELPLNDGTEVKDRVEFYIHTPLVVTGEGNRSRINWYFEHTFKITDEPMEFGVPSKVCYVTENLNVETVEPIDGNVINSDYLHNYLIHKADVTFKFQEGIYLNIYQQSLSEGSAEYFAQVDQLIERTGNMFEGPVGVIGTNFINVDDPEDKVYGYFYATEVDSFNVQVNPANIYIPIPGYYCPPPLPPPPGGGCPVDICCDCLSSPRSTLLKPDYWML